MSEVNVDAQLMKNGRASLSRVDERLVEMQNGMMPLEQFFCSKEAVVSNQLFVPIGRASAFFAILLVATSASAVPVLIDFESFGNVGTTGPTVDTQFPEVTFSSEPGFRNIVSTQPGIGFGLNFLCSAPVGGFIDCAHQTILTFTSPVANLRFFGVGDSFPGVQALVDVFVGGSFAATVGVLTDGQFSTQSLVDLSAFADVTSIRIHTITDLGGLGWDNFSFNTPAGAVPEPSTLLLLALGSAVVAARALLPASESGTSREHRA